MAVKSPHNPVPSALFGTLYRPIIKVKFKVRGGKNWLDVSMIVDTGADYTILPRWLANDLNVDLKADCERHSTGGIGGSETVFLLRAMTVQVGRWTGVIPVGFLTHDDVPPLLGRQDFSEKFRLIIENYTTTFIVPRVTKTNAR